MKNLKITLLPALLSVLIVLASATSAPDKEIQRVRDSASVLREFTGIEERIPKELVRETEGIIIIPKMINAGFAIGVKRGKGVAVVKMDDGTWSDPVFVTLTGGSFGFQIGVQSVDLVLVFRHKGVLTKVKNGDFTIGGDISAAAGPVGRSSTASTDYKLEAEVYSYSRSRGLFAGVSVNGTNLAIDKSANNAYYGSDISSGDIFMKGKTLKPGSGDLRAALKTL